MSRYYFDITNGISFHRDVFGDEFDTLGEARAQAIALLPDLARDRLPDHESHDFLCEVRNEAGRTVYRAKLMFRAERLDEATASSVQDTVTVGHPSASKSVAGTPST